MVGANLLLFVAIEKCAVLETRAKKPLKPGSGYLGIFLTMNMSLVVPKEKESEFWLVSLSFRVVEENQLFFRKIVRLQVDFEVMSWLKGSFRIGIDRLRKNFIL